MALERALRPAPVASEERPTARGASAVRPPVLAVATMQDEARADRAADAIVQGRPPESSDVEGYTSRTPAALLPSTAARIQALSGGARPPEELREAFPVHDFSRVRIHSDGEAAKLARTLGARAFTVGGNVVFGAGEYAPHTAPGRRLLAHELGHVAQQQHGGARAVIQLASIRDYDDADPLHDPSRLTDAEIEATDEYAFYMSMPVATRPSPEEARLACRLLLRAMREGRPTVAGIYVWSAAVLDAELLRWLGTARARSGTTTTAEGSVGDQHWVPASATDVTTPATAASDFTRWMLAGGTEPDPATGRLNCWEMVLFSAYRAGHVTEATMRTIYTDSVAAMATGGAMAFPRTLERRLRSSNVHTYDPADPDSPRPLRGDLVIFREAATHVALATGRRVGGRIEVVSHWPPPDGSYNVKITTIEELLPEITPTTTVAKFWSPIW